MMKKMNDYHTSIQLTNKGIYLSDLFGAREYKVDSMISFLNLPIEVEADFILEDLFGLLNQDVDQYNSIFRSHLAGCDLNRYIYETKLTGIVNEVSFEKLDLFWECISHNNDFTFKPGFGSI